jgi:predicted RNA polymerase sigma factor
VSVVDVREATTGAHHEEWARVVAALTRRFGDLDVAEEAAAEAFATAVARWPVDGVPPNPGAWLTTTANARPSTGFGARTSATTGRRRPSWCTTTTRLSLSAPSTTSGSG